jgi:hypothetical protein
VGSGNGAGISNVVVTGAGLPSNVVTNTDARGTNWVFGVLQPGANITYTTNGSQLTIAGASAAAQTNIAVAGVTNAGTAAYSNAAAFLLPGATNSLAGTNDSRPLALNLANSTNLPNSGLNFTAATNGAAIAIGQLPAGVGVTNSLVGTNDARPLALNLGSSTNLPASGIGSGVIADARLPAYVAQAGTNGLAGTNDSRVMTWTGASSINGPNVTNISAANVTSGTLPVAQLPALASAYPAALTNNHTDLVTVSNQWRFYRTNSSVGFTNQTTISGDGLIQTNAQTSTGLSISNGNITLVSGSVALNVKGAGSGVTIADAGNQATVFFNSLIYPQNDTRIDLGKTGNRFGTFFTTNIVLSGSGSFTGNGSGLTNVGGALTTSSTSPGLNAWTTNTAGSRQLYYFVISASSGVTAPVDVRVMVKNVPGASESWDKVLPYGEPANITGTFTNTIGGVLIPNNGRFCISNFSSGATVTLQNVYSDQ